MKLTKGKISKLFNKKKQSIKRIKKHKQHYNKKTFRNKKIVNLARKSLKNLHYKKYKGGGDPKDGKSVSTAQTPIIDTTPIINTANQNPEEEGKQTTVAPQVAENQASVVDETPIIDTTKKPEEEGKQTSVAPEEEGKQTSVAPPVAENQAPEEEGNQANQVVENQAPEVVENQAPEVAENQAPEEEGKQTSVAPQVVENQANQAAENQLVENQVAANQVAANQALENQDINSSIKNIVSYMVDEITNKVMQNMAGEKPQNGFDAVNKAAETFGNSASDNKK
jgi:hypothetical protein